MRTDSHAPSSRSARRRPRWALPALAVLIWIAIGGIGGPFIGKLATVQSNESTSYLPASAESTLVARAQGAFTSTDTIPAVIVAERPGGITAEDRAFLDGAAANVRDLPGVAGPPSPVIVSEDDAAARVIVGIRSGGEPKEAVAALRAALERGRPAGLSVLVTGPAGQIADLTKAFAGIDGTLLLVAALVVMVILVAVYRSPLLPLIVILSAVFALALAGGAVYALASRDLIALNGQSQGILFILVFGAATDYALLLVARFREELHHTDDNCLAVRRAWRGVVEPLAASATTVILGVLCLLFSDLNSNRGLGPVAAIGIAASFAASLTFLPAMLALAGPTAFWPARPRRGATGESGGWWAVANMVRRRHRAVWIVTGVGLLACAAFLPQFKASGVAQSSFFLTQVDSVTGQRVLGEHFPGGTGAPAIVVAEEGSADAVATAVRTVPGVSDGPGAVHIRGAAGIGSAPTVVQGRVLIQATLADPADSEAAVDTVRRIRTAVSGVPGAQALVGGTTATQLDTQDTAARDRNTIIPLVLIVVFAVLLVLMRALVAPILLMASVVLSFAATLGVAALVFNHLFHFPGADPTVPLFGFVFLVALGVDYNIFLMTRVREEARRHGPGEGMRRGLAVTGGVITSAGVVLAATFGSLAVIPLLFLAQVAFIVAFGVLLDTLIVRSLLVPALGFELGRYLWFPSALGRRSGPGIPRLGSTGPGSKGAARSVEGRTDAP